MECPKGILVDNHDRSSFWVNIPNPRGNTPLQVCQYHYRTYMITDQGKKTWKTVWEPLNWTPWGNNFGVHH